MASSRGRRPETVAKCRICGDVLVVLGRQGEVEVVCRRPKCRRDGVTTPIRPPGWIPIPEEMDSAVATTILVAVQEGRFPVEQAIDPLWPYRQIPGLLVMGPAEIERAFLRPDDRENPNPLGLSEGWCKALAPEVPRPPEELARVVEYCQTPEWNDQPDGCTPILRLMLREISYGGEAHPVSPANLYQWFGRPHDGFDPGLVHQDVQWANWFLAKEYKELDWVSTPAVLQAEWQVSYLPHPAWTTKKKWMQQQEAISQRPGLRLGTGPEEVWMMDILTANWQRLRESTFTRTSTIFDGYPLEVHLYSDGVDLRRRWRPGNAEPGVGAAAVGVLAA